MIVEQENPEVDEFIEHYGKKGMKWGQRNQKRLERANRVAGGTASKKEAAAFFLTDTSRYSVRKNKGIKGAAASRARELQGRKDRILKGEATVKDILALYGGDRLRITGKQ
jgi:t-SNARE complex subunit (syntaxin)